MKKKLMKSMAYYAPITRVDEEQRIVEGIAFANEVVSGEGGVCLRSSAMELATPDYMKFGTIRVMHQPKAAGTLVPNDAELRAQCGVFWEDGDNGQRVARVVAYISDVDEFRKIQDGTYKGLSVGVQPTVARGQTIEKCNWIETSLVDRPKDPDALFTSYRSADLPEETEVELLESYSEAEQGVVDIQRRKWSKEKRDETSREDFGDPENEAFPIADQEDVDAAAHLIGHAENPEAVKGRIKKIAVRKGLKLPDSWQETSQEQSRVQLMELARGKFADAVKNSLPSRLRYMTLDMLGDVLWDVQNIAVGTPEEKAAIASEAIEEFKKFIIPVVSAGSWPNSDIFGDLTAEDRTAMPAFDRMYEIGHADVVAANETISRLEIQVSEGQSELTRVQGLLTEQSELTRVAVEKVTELEKQPKRLPPLVRNFNPLDKGFPALGEASENQAEITTLRARLDEVSQLAPSPDTRVQEQRLSEILSLKSALRRLGETI